MTAENMRLQSFLSNSGVASRRAVVEIIESGKVRVNGKIIREKGRRINPLKDRISVDGKILKIRSTNRYILFNKPAGVVTTLKDENEKRKISDYFKDVKERVYPVGRLDKDTQGLLLLTNDGELAFRLSHPSYEIDKVYRTLVKGEIPALKLAKLRGGIRLDGKMTSPCHISVLKKQKDSTLYKFIIHEGFKRQIRRMLEWAGVVVLTLKRTKYASLTLQELPSGTYRDLSKIEVKKLKKLVKLH